MPKKKFYMVLDTETATLPFADSICKNAVQKQKVAIAKPLVYDIGWIICDRRGEVIKKENFLVQETFFVPNIFNTAYYKDKRPLYMELLEKGKIVAAKWEEVVNSLITDLNFCDLVCAYNACFDFKKAIPFTERYIKQLYSTNYNKWEEGQRKKCEKIIKGKDENNNSDYLNPFFELRGKEYPIADLWGVACEKLINNSRYKDYCLENELLTSSAMFFKTSAETTFRYLMRQYDFIESHTALEDALIEKDILVKALKKGKVEPQIKEFPFRVLGTCPDYVREKPKHKGKVKKALEKYIKENGGAEYAEGIVGTSGQKNYWKRIVNLYEEI